MYDYDYETDVLLVLRLLKYLQEQDQTAATSLIQWQKKFDPDMMYELAESIIWEIFADVEFESDTDWENSIANFSHPIIDRLYELGGRLNRIQGSPAGSWQRKIHDIVEFYVCGASYSIMDLNVTAIESFIQIKVLFSPDCYEPLLFGNSMVDVLLYCQRECQRLEGLLQLEGEITESQGGEEAA